MESQFLLKMNGTKNVDINDKLQQWLITINKTITIHVEYF